MSLYAHTPHPHTPRNPNERHKAERQGFNQRLAVVVTKRFGSMGMFYVLVAWMFVWMTLATTGLWVFRRDPYPFTFLLFLSNLVQLWALPVLAVGQNVLNRHAELQADEMYHGIVRLLHENEQATRHLDAQDAELLKQTGYLVSLASATRPELLVVSPPDGTPALEAGSEIHSKPSRKKVSKP